MRSLVRFACFGAVLVVILSGVSSANPKAFLNRIEGRVFDENRVILGDMYVELQNDAGSTLSTQRSTPLGRFTFVGLSAGSYRVRVLPSGKNFLEQSQDLQFIPSMTGRSDETQFLEFYMRVDKRATQPIAASSPDVIYYQDVPDTAKKLYRSGIENLEKKDDKGLADLESAIKEFPMYFDALSRLGKEYALRKQYEKAYPLLLRAIDINARSYSSFYVLGYTFYKMNQIPAAIKAAEASTIIQPDAADGHVLYGTLLRIHGDFQDAEKTLKKAISVSKGRNAQAHWQMALLLNRLNRNSEAADELEAYLKLAPPDDAEKKTAQDLIVKLRGAKKS